MKQQRFVRLINLRTQKRRAGMGSLPIRFSLHSRRSFVRKAGGFAAMAWLCPRNSLAAAAQGGFSKQPGVLFEGLTMPPIPGSIEAILTQLAPDRYCLFFGEDH